MMNKIKICAIIAIMLGAVTVFQTRQFAQTKVETAGQKFKNIKVLNDVPADQIGKIMNMMSASLGVDCKMCHVSNEKDFDKDGIDHKDIARKMLTMTFDLNKKFFDGKPEVSCNTCHNGHERPVSAPSLTPVAAHVERPAQPKIKPTADEILEKYTAALGGTEKLASVRSRIITATRVEPDDKTTEPEIVTQTPGKLRVDTKYGDYLVVESFDGTHAWKMGGGSAIDLHADEAEQIHREAQIFGGADLKAIYTKLDYRFTDRIDGREVVLVIGTLADESRERLYFDSTTGLLVRRIATTPTVLGPFQYQVDYSDYRDFGGVKLPASIRFAMPGISWTRKINAVKIDEKVSPALFTETTKH